MSDSYGPSEDCIVCGQPQIFGSLRHCHGCETDMCGHCRINHNCQKIMDDRLEEFIKKLSPPLADVLEKFGYSVNDERVADGQKIFEFTSSDAPRIEVRLDKP